MFSCVFYIILFPIVLLYYFFLNVMSSCLFYITRSVLFTLHSFLYFILYSIFVKSFTKRIFFSEKSASMFLLNTLYVEI